jgi:hypothetical protein
MKQAILDTMKIIRSFLPAIAILAATLVAHASSVLPLTLDEHLQSADAVFRGTVLGVESFRVGTNGMIYTRTVLRVDEGFKGRLPAVINVVHRGGVVGGIGMTDDASPQFKTGEERLLFVSRRNDGTLFSTRGDEGVVRLRRERGGAFASEQESVLNKLRAKTNWGRAPGADVTGQAQNPIPDGSITAPSGDNGGASTNGLLVDANGVPERYLLPDRGEPIPYLVDATYLPAGMTLASALNAVSNAMSAWASASSFKFVFAGTNNFGTAAGNINNSDGIFRIQLHDNYGFITGPNILGEGGSWFTSGLLATANWGPGGNVAGMEFNKGLNGYVVLKHTNVAMQTLSTFTEVLTHEIGHVIGLAHSSDITTNNSALTNSIMYYLVHADGRGASLTNYDTNVVREVHPLNTPPFTFDRVMDITTASTAPNIAGINAIDMRGYDLQSTNLTAIMTNLTSINGSFSQVGNTIKYTPRANFSDSGRLDPAGLSYYDLFYARVSDGTNASPYVMVRVLSFNNDSYPTPSDGIPNNWMTCYFGNANPAVGQKHYATNDYDGDGLNNLSEYRAGMNPTNSSSAQRITALANGSLQFQAKAYELYEIQGSTNLASSNWTRVVNPVLPTNAPFIIRTNLLATNIVAVVSNLPTTNSKMFFRILKVP